jgi:hypothetical protein
VLAAQPKSAQTWGLFGMAPTPSSSLELGGASYAPKLQKLVEQPNSMELVELQFIFLEHLFCSSKTLKYGSKYEVLG